MGYKNKKKKDDKKKEDADQKKNLKGKGNGNDAGSSSTDDNKDNSDSNNTADMDYHQHRIALQILSRLPENTSEEDGLIFLSRGLNLRKDQLENIFKALEKAKQADAQTSSSQQQQEMLDPTEVSNVDPIPLSAANHEPEAQDSHQRIQAVPPQILEPAAADSHQRTQAERFEPSNVETVQAVPPQILEQAAPDSHQRTQAERFNPSDVETVEAVAPQILEQAAPHSHQRTQAERFNPSDVETVEAVDERLTEQINNHITDWNDLDDIQGMLATLQSKLNLSDSHLAEIKRRYDIVEEVPPPIPILQPQVQAGLRRSDQKKMERVRTFLSRLPAGIAEQVSALSPEDKEVVAYVMRSGGDFPLRKDSHRPSFNCGCFYCYGFYWKRLESSLSSQTIHNIMVAYDEFLKEL